MNCSRPGWMLPAIFTALLVAAPASSEDDCTRPLNQYQVRHFGSDQGLPLDSVYSLIQDDSGFLWIGTEDGLARFDGRQFERIRLEHALDGAPEVVKQLALTTDGSILAGVDSAGLLLIDPADTGAARMIHRIRSPAEALVHAEGMAYLGVHSRGLVIIDVELESVKQPSADHAETTIRSLARRAAGGVWIGYDGGGVQWFDGEAFHSPAMGTLPSPFVTSLHEAPGGRLWIGTRNGLFSWNGERVQRHGAEDGLMESPLVVSIAETRAGQLWIGTGGDGVARRCGERFEMFGQGRDLGRSLVNAILEDREGSLWVATGGNGIFQLIEGAATALTERQGLPAYPVLPIAQGADGAMWIGTFGGGVVRLENGRMHIIDESSGLSSGRVLSLAPDPDGGMWAGTRSGLNYLEDGTVSRVYGEADGLDTSITALLAEDDALWIGLVDGFASLRDGRISRIESAAGPFSAHSIRIFRSADGHLWVGSFGEGLFVLNEGKLEPAAFNDSLPSHEVFDIIEPEPGLYWLATSRGLARWDGESVLQIDTRHGLPQSRIFSILEDGLGNFWFSGNRGVFRVSLSDLEDAALGRSGPVEALQFDHNDGMPRSEANGGFQPAAWRDRRGRLWYPTVEGAAIFDPSEHHRAGPLPRPVVTGVVSSDWSLPANDSIQVPPRPDWIDLSYSAPTFQRPEHLSYRYRLLGFDDNWFETASESALFRKIPPGRYIFEVQARVAGGSWSDSRRQILDIERHWLENRFYWVLAALVIAFGVVLAVRAHLRRRQARQEQMQQAHKLEAVGLLAGGIAHDFNNVLTAITNGTELLADRMPSDSRARADAERVLRAAERGAGLTHQLLTFAGHQKIEPSWVDLAAELRGMHEFLDRLLPDGIEVHWDQVEFVGYCHIDPIQFQQVVINLVVNARDAMAGRGKLFIALETVDPAEAAELGADADVLCAVLRVRDTGPGMERAIQERIFEPFFTTKSSAGGSGLGLAIVYSIVREVGGWLGVNSKPGEGATFQVLLPVRREIGAGDE